MNEKINELDKQMEGINITKKDGNPQAFSAGKIISAVSKSAKRVNYTFSDEEKLDIIEYVVKRIERSKNTEIPVSDMHDYVESALDMVNPKVAKSYRDYRNWKMEWAKDFGNLFEKANKIRYIGDKDVPLYSMNLTRCSTDVLSQQRKNVKRWMKVIFTSMTVMQDLIP